MWRLNLPIMKMTKTERKKTFDNLFADYRLAKVRPCKDWIIVYYCYNPHEEKLVRCRLRVPPNDNIDERKKTASQMAKTINENLKKGWSPFKNESKNLFMTFEEVKYEFLNVLKKEVNDGIKRPDTLRSYSSMLSIFESFFLKKYSSKYIYDLNREFIFKYLDWIYSRGNSPTSYNNYLTFTKVFCNFLFSRGYTRENPAQGIPRKRKLEKIRKVIPNDKKAIISEYLKESDFGFFVLCMCTYYAFIRGTELTKLKVSDVDLNNNVFYISGEQSKNKTAATVTIPNKLKELLELYLQGVDINDCNTYLFDCNFNPGIEKLTPSKINHRWTKYRKKMKLGKEFKFYSLKDTGITDLLIAGVPSIKVRDQARHSSLKITELYTPRIANCDLVVQNANFEF